MLSSVLLAIGLVTAWGLYKYVAALRHNINLARKSGLPYVVYPIHPLNLFWQLTGGLWIPLIQRLPKSWWEGRIIPMYRDWAYKSNQKFFDWAGGENVIIVGPDDMTLFTESPEVISQMTMRKDAFPKDIARYGVLRMFGQNVVTTEGTIWRMHRKVTASSFNEKNAAHTFREAIAQTQGMLDFWFGAGDESKDSTKTIRSLEHDTMIWALNIIGYVGFGLRLIWPGQKLPDDPILAKYGSLDPPPGYTLTFAASLGGLLARITPILIIPAPILKRLPFDFAREATSSKDDYYKYMGEFLRHKIDEVRSGSHERVGMDIMGELVRSVYGDEKQSGPGSGPGAGAGAKLTDDEIISNAFIMTLAGHETTANVLHFTLIELATNPAAQRLLQRDVDTLLGETAPATWDYERNINALLASHVGACINETMRMMPPVTSIPKIVNPSSDQAITIRGVRHVLPAGLSIEIIAPSVHRNPNWWPTRPSTRTGALTDLEEWLPERWYRDSNGGKGGATSDDETIEDTTDYGGFQGSDTSASLYRPVRGSFVPFSDGPRSCLGRRIAIVELAAALPSIFRQYSVELAVDEWATDDEVTRMGPEERRCLYQRAQEASREQLLKAGAIITLKLHGGEHVPVRFVRRGKERFIGDLE